MKERDARLRQIQGTRRFTLHPFPSTGDGKSLQSNQRKRRDPRMLTSRTHTQRLRQLTLQEGSHFFQHTLKAFYLLFGILSRKTSIIWHLRKVSRSLAAGTGFEENNFSTDLGWGLGGGLGMIQEQQWVAAVNTDEASLTPLPLTSCCVARLLSGHRYKSTAQGLGNPALRGETETQTHRRKHGGNGHDTRRRKLG